MENKIENLMATITPYEFIDKMCGITEPVILNDIMDLFGGRDKVMCILINYFKENIEHLNTGEVYELFTQILFQCSNNESYTQDWEILWDKLNVLPLYVIVRLLEEHTPKKRNENNVDASLNYLLNNRYNSRLTKEIYQELKDLFECEPEEFKTFRRKQNFIDKVSAFDDADYICNTYCEINFNESEILELLKQVVIDKKIDTIEKLNVFIRMVKFYAPLNNFNGRRYRDVFVLEIFEGNDNGEVQSWDQEQVDIWYEEFPNIDFNYTSYRDVKDRIDNINSEEAKHITSKLKDNPNYNHN